MLFCLLLVNSFPVERNHFSFLSWCLRSSNLTSPLSRQPAYFFRPLLPYYPVFRKSEGFRSIPIANFFSRGRGYCLFFTSFKNILVRLLRISRSPYVWCWPFRPSFPFRKHSKPYHCWKEGLLLFGCCKGIAFRLSPSLCNSPRGLLFFSSSISRSGEAFPLLRINRINLSSTNPCANSCSAWLSLSVSPQSVS